MMIKADKLDKALDSLLDSAFDRASWGRTLDGIQSAVGGTGANILPITNRLPAEYPHSDSLGEAFQTYFDDQWYANDHRQHGVSRMMKQGYFLDQEFTDRDFFEHNAYYKFLRKYGLGWSAVVGFSGYGGTMAMVLHRDVGRGPFTQEEGRLLLGMRSRLSLSASLARKLAESHAQGVVQAFNSMNLACLLFDRRGQVTHANTRAEQMLGPDLQCHRGELSARSAVETALLRKRIRDVCQSRLLLCGDNADALCISRFGQTALLIRVQRLTDRFLDSFSPSVALAVLEDPDESRQPDISILTASFGLTATEGAIAIDLAAGTTLRA